MDPRYSTEAEVHSKTRIDLDVVLNVRSVCLVTSTGFGDGILRDDAAIDGAQQITCIGKTRGGVDRSGIAAGSANEIGDLVGLKLNPA